MFLTLFTTFVVSKTIGYRGRPIKASSLEEPFHLRSQLMSTTNTFMNLCHSQPSFIRTQTLLEQIIRGPTIQFTTIENKLKSPSSNFSINRTTSIMQLINQRLPSILHLILVKKNRGGIFTRGPDGPVMGIG
jgi:hypothetical protein